MDPCNPVLSIVQQSSLLEISRSSVYYESEINSENVRIMHAIDAIFTDCPFYGSRKIRFMLGKLYGIRICREHVQHLMRLMGLTAIYPKQKPHTSAPDALQRKYPYLLRNLPVTRPNQVWGTDITYVRLEKGFCYLVAIIDWYSRYVICWQLSETLDINFCIENLQRALTLYIPDMHNSDQGSHFTSPQYTHLLAEKNIQISMDGRGRCMDNIFTERLWRSVKYENIFLHSYANASLARKGLEIYFPFYNTERPHQSLGYRTPAELYFQKKISVEEEKMISVNALCATIGTGDDTNYLPLRGTKIF